MGNAFLSREKLKSDIQQLIEGGAFTEATYLLSDYKEIFPDDPEYYSMQTCIAILRGELQEAEGFILNGLRHSPTDSDLLYNWVYLLKLQGRDKEGIAAYARLRLFDEGKYSVEGLSPSTNGLATERVRVLHGTMEIANQMSTLSDGLNRKGVSSDTLSYYPNYLKYKADYVYDLTKLGDPANDIKTIAAQFIAEYDIFHFHFGTSLTLDYSDLPLLRDLGKKVFMHHWGSDVRYLSKAREINPYIKVKTADEAGIKRALDFLSRHIEHAVVADHELYMFVKDYYKNIHFIPQAINLDNYPYSPCVKRDRLLLVHAPTSPEIKGSQYIIDAVEKLKPHYNIDFRLIQGMAHSEAKALYQEADIIIDQILCGSYGLLAIEGMAMGKPVVCWITDYMREHYSNDLPLLSANPDTVYRVLKQALDNRDSLPDIGRRGRAYVEKNHDTVLVAGQLAALYKSIR